MPETSTAGIFQVAFIARQMEQTPRAFFQTTFNPIGRACAARHARAGLGLQGKWRTRACLAAHTLPCGLRLADCSRFCGCKRFEKQLRFSAVDCRSSEKQKAACTTCFPCRTLSPNSHPSSLPWERVRERATSHKACIGTVRVRVLGKVAEIRGMPSPQPSPTGEGAGCSRFRRCRSSEKECPKYQRQGFFR